MTDDIVTRLRDRAEERQEALDEYWRGHKFDYDFPMLESQAADEIERLRQMLSEVQERHSAQEAKHYRIIRELEADRDRWAKWGKHVFICPNKGVNPCRDCVSPATADAMKRVDRGGKWYG